MPRKYRLICVSLCFALGCYEIYPADDAGASPGTGSNAGTQAAGGTAGQKPSAGTGTAGRGIGSTGVPVQATDGGSSSAAGGTHGGVDAGGGGSLALSTDPGLRVAFIGDQAINLRADAVLRLIKNEQADLLIHAGDFDYVENVAGWQAQIDAVLGPAFPYFAAIGNHDVLSWPGPGGYQAGLYERLSKIAGATCTGDLGVNSVCRYRGLMFVLSGVGTYGTGTEEFLDEALDAPDVWRLCVWHKNQHDMQVGGKIDEVGWRAYQLCQAKGAPIITAHEHSYGRTHTLTDVGNAAAEHGFIGLPEHGVIGAGSTVVFQTGLGGHSYRAWNGDFAPWWATIYAAKKQLLNEVDVGTDSAIEFGALFIDFHVEQDPHLAHGYFKTTSGKVVDEFTLRVVQ